ncbi:transposase [Deinococcus aquiradiocola]|uniref:Transposase n=1 Tax=Deinococcus aquiradiocola TaxID=393059 RepID=A0A917URA3_9DEIO|nr:transposase [Deinococcus aquiradiocola]
MHRTDLTPQQWVALQPLLPRNPKRGQAYASHRKVLNGILWRIKTGAPWRDVPRRYGPWQTCYDRFVRWSRDGTWLRLLQTIQATADQQGEIDWDKASVDSTHIRAQRSASGARKTLPAGEKRGAVSMNGSGSAGAVGPARSTS